jgi:uncharacterized protein (UPF0332 family)
MSGIWEKARVAGRSAHLLLKADDADGAVNRAYYVMFDAAKPALASVDPKLAEGKTHSSIIRRFSLHLVRPGHISAALGRILNETEELRLAADYEAGPTGAEEARITVERMTLFLDAIETFLARGGP